MENMIDNQYAAYIEKKKSRSQRRKEAGEASDDETDIILPSGKTTVTKIKGFEPKVSGNILSDDEDEEEQDDADDEDNESDIDDEDLEDMPKKMPKKRNELLVKEDDEPTVTSSKKASMWFSQFKSLNEDVDEDLEIQKMKKKMLSDANKKRVREAAEAEEDEDSEDEEYRKKKEAKVV